MRRNYIFAFINLILLMQVACSYRNYYVIVNATNEPLLIEYRFKELPDAEERKKKGFLKEKYYYYPPAIKSFDDLNDQTGAWKNVLETTFNLNEDTGDLTISLAAGNVLKIYQDNGQARTANGAINFPLVQLSLTGNSGRVTYEGKMVYKQFVKLNGATYQIRYE